MARVEIWQLRQRQGLPLEIKEKYTKKRIKEWYNYWESRVYISFSGGRDSTVLLHQVRKIYPDIPAVFVDTGLEYPEIREFVKTIDNVIWLHPEMSFHKVIKKYGYPVVSKKVARQIRDIQNPTEKNKASRILYLNGVKRDGTKTKYFKLPNKWRKLAFSNILVSEKCCDIMKKKPLKQYQKESGRKPYIGMMAVDSQQRLQTYLQVGCNAFEGKLQSNPMGFWLDSDVWDYLHKYGISYSKIYDMGEKHTGCMFCMFGIHLGKGENRFQRMKKTHPKQYEYCINKLGCGKVLDFIGVNYKEEPRLFDDADFSKK